MATEDKRTFLTFQDFEKVEERDLPPFILKAIDLHRTSDVYKIAQDADLYDKQLNSTVNEYVKCIFSLSGSKLVDFTAANNRIASNFFHRLNTQRCMYSLGNGVSFIETGEEGDDKTKEALGRYFDHDIQEAAYKALIHGVSFCFWDLDRVHVFPVTEFVPLWDEYDGTLRAGIRFWRLSPDRPMSVVLYEEDGFTKFATDEKDGSMQLVQEKKSYLTRVRIVPADRVEEVIDEYNYSTLPIIPLWGSKLHQSTLVGMKSAIDSYDLIRSGFANDLSDCALIYWIVENAGGMTDADLTRFRDRLLLQHIANVDTSSGSNIKPYTQDLPYQARQAYLTDIKSEIYESFGALDVHAVSAGATNDHIDAAYQPLDEEASDFEFQLSECIVQILNLQGIEDHPVFKRKRISNEKEQVEMIVMEAQWLDQQTILNKFPNISPKEVQAIMKSVEEENMERMSTQFPVDETIEVEEEDGAGMVSA